MHPLRSALAVLKLQHEQSQEREQVLAVRTTQRLVGVVFQEWWRVVERGDPVRNPRKIAGPVPLP